MFMFYLLFRVREKKCFRYQRMTCSPKSLRGSTMFYGATHILPFQLRQKTCLLNLKKTEDLYMPSQDVIKIFEIYLELY